jgi:hypothetical protein
MAPIPRADLVDMDNPSSDVGDSQDSPMRRQFSEPFRPQSTSTQISQSPDPRPMMFKCDWCGKLIELPNDESLEEEVILAHGLANHPDHLFGQTGYDEVEDGTFDEQDELNLNEEDGEDDQDAEIEGAEEEEEEEEEEEDAEVDAEIDDEATAEAEEAEAELEADAFDDVTPRDEGEPHDAEVGEDELMQD